MSSVMMWQASTSGASETERLGELLGGLLKGGEVIELCADLGGGKTTCVRGLAKGLGSKDNVSSPTFTLSKIYKGREGMELHHFDFYRLDEPGVIADQLAESLDDSSVVTVVEWSNIVTNVLPEERLVLEFHSAKTNPDERMIHLHYPEKHAGIIRELETRWVVSEP